MCCGWLLRDRCHSTRWWSRRRPVSDAIARRLGIRHETPQAFVIYQGQVFFHASHYAITPDALNKTLDQLDCAGSSAE